MPKRQSIGVVTSDKMTKTRRVEIAAAGAARASTARFMRRKTVCHVHDENNESHDGDTVEIIESPPRRKTEALGPGADRHARASRSISRPCEPRPKMERSRKRRAGQSNS